MSRTVDLSGIEVIEADRRFIRQARSDVNQAAHQMLQQGIEAQVSQPSLILYWNMLTSSLENLTRIIEFL